MKCRLININDLLSFIDLIYDSVTNIELQFKNTGLTISMLNNSHVCFYTATFTKDYFDLYDLENEESVLVDSKDLFKILKSISSKDTVIIETNDASIIFRADRVDGTFRVFEAILIDELYNTPSLPSIDYNYSVLVDFESLKQSVDDMINIVGTDRFKMVLNNSKLIITAPPDSLMKYNNILLNSVEGKGDVIVNIQYMKELNKLNKINQEVLFHIGENIPLSWTVNSIDETVQLQGLIAPILEED